MNQIRVYMLDYIEDCRQSVFAPNFDHIDVEEAMQVLHVLHDATNVLEHLVQLLPHPTFEDLVNLCAQLLEIVEIIESFCERILIPLSDADENDLALGGNFHLLNIREGIVLDADAAGFLFTYREHAWMPDVIHQLFTPFCWAFSSSQLLLAIYSFQRLRRGPLLSTQCLINGVAHHAPQDMKRVNLAAGTYEASSCAALRFVERRGCDLEENVPYVQRREDDLPFLRIAEIQGDPFSIHPDSTIYAIRAAMEDYGCLVGVFEYDQTFNDYHGPPEVYYIDEDASVTRPLHYALISGVGCSDGGRPFLQIQNSYGVEWCDGGYGFIAKDLFHYIHGLRGVRLRRE